MFLILKRMLCSYAVGFLVYAVILAHPGAGLADEYTIGSGDTLYISVWGNEQLTRSVAVRPDGKISLPLLNDLQVSGLSPMQLRDLIADRLKEYINAPNVTVTVTEMKSFNVFVQGEVGKPGMHPLHQEMTLLHLISLAGGVTEKADLTRAYLLRNGERMPVDFHKLLRKGDQTQNVALKPNDLIMIPDNFDQRVTIVGEVSKPQVIPFREGMTVMDVILEAGDFTNFARRNGTKIVRRNGTGTTEIQVKITDITRKGDMSQNIPVLPGDTILVPRSLF